MKRITLILLACLYGGTALAGTKTQTFKPVASVSNVCVVQSTDNLSFGNYLPSNAAPLQTTGQIKLRCTKGAAVSVVPTTGGSAMSGGGSSLSYRLYADSAYQNIWGAPAYAYMTYDFNSSTGIAARFQQYVTLSACSNLANGGAYYYTAGSQVCAYAFGSTGVGTTMVYGNNSGLVSVTNTGVQTTLRTASNGAIFYISSNSTRIGTTGYQYTFPISQSGSNTVLSQTSTGVNTPIALTYYGQVPAKQDVPPGTYTDSVIVQVSF